MGNWSKVPALQIAGILGENGLASERELWIDNALKEFDRALVGADFSPQHLCSARPQRSAGLL